MAATIQALDEPFILFSSSAHPAHPAENILEKSLKSFWTSTGMFPQEIIVHFPSDTILTKVVLSCRKAAQIQFFTAQSPSPSEDGSMKPEVFELFGDQSLEDSDAMQVCSAEPARPLKISKIKIMIVKGYDAFCSVHRLVTH